MTTLHYRARQAELRDQYNRMAGLVVAVICSAATLSFTALAFALLP